MISRSNSNLDPQAARLRRCRAWAFSAPRILAAFRRRYTMNLTLPATLAILNRPGRIPAASIGTLRKLEHILMGVEAAAPAPGVHRAAGCSGLAHAELVARLEKVEKWERYIGKRAAK